ncbi:bacillithiol biosynthesis cysteine-adding enzyme BshC [Pseudopedobacter beijingensis]|uniref:Putative cysteine ligase BshC n=1 Tax=Pseudopedobacter beijingensis TaxID=1207056 RepID=A0ABW4I6I6_9SPHI
MEAQYIDYKETHSFSSAVIRYLEDDASLKPFYNQKANLHGFEELLKNKKVTCNRETLVAILKEQYSKLAVSSAVTTNINNLLNKNTYTVTTGHQLNIFTGPLYFLFKIVSSINLAKELKIKFPEKDFVPVYWMASEDHDFAEINHTYVQSEKISWNKEASGATGRLSTEDITNTLNEYTGILGFSENAQELAKIISAAYQQNSLADATRFLVNELFGLYGLVILDADDKRLKDQFSDIIYQDIISQNSYNNITATNKRLEEVGVAPQVNPREINFFYLTDHLRERIVFEDNLYKVLNTSISFTQEQLKTEITEHPDRFSPNVVMRPLYQEYILPNLAYIGGGAELVYWLQLKSNFDFYHIDFPILILRNSAMIANSRIKQKLSRLGLCYKDVFKSEKILTDEWVRKSSEHQLGIEDEWREIDCIFEKLKLRAHKIDPTLSPSTEAIKVRLEKAMSNLEKKLLKAEKKNHAEAIHNIKTIKEALFPYGGLQERKENFGMFYVKYGQEFIADLIKHLHPLDFKFTILT